MLDTNPQNLVTQKTEPEIKIQDASETIPDNSNTSETAPDSQVPSEAIPKIQQTPPAAMPPPNDLPPRCPMPLPENPEEKDLPPPPKYTVAVPQPIIFSELSPTEKEERRRSIGILTETQAIFRAFLRIKSLAEFWATLWRTIQTDPELTDIKNNAEFNKTWLNVQYCLLDVIKYYGFQDIEQAIAELQNKFTEENRQYLTTQELTNKSNSLLEILNTVLEQTSPVRENMMRLLAMNGSVTNFITAIETLIGKNPKLLKVNVSSHQKTEPLQSVFSECTGQFFSARLGFPLGKINKLTNDQLKNWVGIINIEVEASDRLQKTPTLQNAENTILMVRQKAAEQKQSIIKPKCIELSYLLLKNIDQLLAKNKSLGEKATYNLLLFREYAFQLYFHKDATQFINEQLKPRMLKMLDDNKELLGEAIYNSFINILYQEKYNAKNLHAAYTAVESRPPAPAAKENLGKTIKVSDSSDSEHDDESADEPLQNIQPDNPSFNSYEQFISAENYVQQQFIRFASDFITDYLNKDKSRQFKNELKHQFLNQLQQEFKRLYTLSFEKRREEMQQYQYVDVQGLCLHTLKRQLRLHQLSYTDLHGEIKSALDKKLQLLDNFQVVYQSPLEVDSPAPKAQVLDHNNSIKKDKIDNLVTCADKEKPTVLISMLLMTLDYYENNYLGKRIADQNNIPPNSKLDQTHLEKLRDFSNRQIFDYVRSPEVEMHIVDVLSALQRLIQSMLSEWNITHSRLVATLVHIYNHFATLKYNPYEEFLSYQIKDNFPALFDPPSLSDYESLPLQIFDSLNLKDSRDSQLYIQQHIANQVRQKFVIPYKAEISSRNTTHTDPLKLTAINAINHKLNQLIEPENNNAPLKPKNIIPKIDRLINESTKICGNVLEVFEKGEFGKAYKNTTDYLEQFSTLQSRYTISVNCYEAQKTVLSIANIFADYIKNRNTIFYPTPWVETPAVKILNELNTLFNMTETALLQKIINERRSSIQELCQKILEHHTTDLSAETDPNSFNACLGRAYNYLNVHKTKIVESARLENKTPETLVVSVLRICDYYRNTPLGKQLVAEKNEQTYFADHIQQLANTLLKYSSNGKMNTIVILKHIRNTIDKIRGTAWRGNTSRLASTLEQLHNDFCTDPSQYVPIPPNTSLDLLPDALLSYTDNANTLATYRRCHIVNKVQELLGRYETHLQQSWLTLFKMTKPYKKEVTASLHQKLEELSKLEFIEELDDPEQPNAIVDKLKTVFETELSTTDGKTELPFFSQGEFGKSKRAIDAYLESITAESLANQSVVKHPLSKIELLHLLLADINQLLANSPTLNTEVLTILLQLRDATFKMYLHPKNLAFTKLTLNGMEALLDNNKELLSSQIYNSLIDKLYQLKVTLPAADTDPLDASHSKQPNKGKRVVSPKPKKSITSEIHPQNDNPSIHSENYLQQQFLIFAADFITDYLANDKSRQFKNQFKHSLIAQLQLEFKRLYTLSLKERKKEMKKHKCSNVLELCMYTFEQQLRLNHFSYSDLDGEFKLVFEKKLNQFTSFQSINDSESVDTNTDDESSADSIPKTPIVLIRMVLMTLDYYENNYLGKKIAGQNNISPNKEIDATRSEQIRALANTLIHMHLNNRKNSRTIEDLLPVIKGTIDAISNEFLIKNNINESRLLETLITIYNSFLVLSAPVIPHINSDIELLPFDLLDFNNDQDNELYFQQHIANQVHHKLVIQYKEKVSSRDLTYTNSEKLTAINDIDRELHQLIESEILLESTASIIPTINETLKKYTYKFDEHDQIFNGGEFGKAYQSATAYLNFFRKQQNILDADADLGSNVEFFAPDGLNDFSDEAEKNAKNKEVIKRVNAYFTAYTSSKLFAFNPTPWIETTSVKIKKELNALYNMTDRELIEKLRQEQITIHDVCKKILAHAAAEHSETDQALFNLYLNEAYRFLNAATVDASSESTDTDDEVFALIKQEKDSAMLVVAVLKICDYYRNTPLGKQLVAGKNEQTYFADHIQRLANTLLKFSATGQIDKAVVLKHMRNTIHEIRDTDWRGVDSRMARTLEQLHNDSCDPSQQVLIPTNASNKQLPQELVSCTDNPQMLATYRRRHIVYKVRELLGQYESHLQKSWLTLFNMTKPYKKEVTASLHQTLEALSTPEVIDKLDDSAQPNATVEILQTIFKDHLSGIDGETELSFFSQGEFGKLKRAIETYFQSIAADELILDDQARIAYGKR